MEDFVCFNVTWKSAKMRMKEVDLLVYGHQDLVKGWPTAAAFLVTFIDHVISNDTKTLRQEATAKVAPPSDLLLEREIGLEDVEGFLAARQLGGDAGAHGLADERAGER